MFERHRNKDQYFNEQVYTTDRYVIPFIEKHYPITSATKVIEIGCAEGGNIKPFLDRDCKVTGIDIAGNRVALAKEFYKTHPKVNNLSLVVEDIYKAEGKIDKDFDLVIMRDVIEHIPDQERFMEFLKRFLAPNGKVFLAFPPWQNPFGGHQQMCVNKVLSKMPFMHLLPTPLYKMVLKLGNESAEKINNLIDIKNTGLSLDRFNRILKKTGYKIDKRVYYFINPNYEVKFKLKPRITFGFIGAIPFIRNFFTTAGYYLVSKK